MVMMKMTAVFLGIRPNLKMNIKKLDYIICSCSFAGLNCDFKVNASDSFAILG